eukprot:SM000240S08606  [mRNA]  locus=s240:134650:140591:+ [translate_table: standard]
MRLPSLLSFSKRRNAPPPPSAAAAAEPLARARPQDGSARPIRLLHSDDNGRFVVDDEAVAALRSVKGPVGVVAVCGRARQGKSFILNQLLGRSSGFQVAPTHRPCTKGLWMWSAPVQRELPDGTRFHLVLLDSEGIDAYDQTGTYSTQIFSLAVLLSSLFIYNQMGGIDEAALDRLALVTEMTKHIRVRAGEAAAGDELGHFSPTFLWLLRDFYLELSEDGRQITPREYLEAALRPTAATGAAAAAKNQIRTSIRALFPDRDCFTLVRPVNMERDLQHLDQLTVDQMRPEFLAGLDSLTRLVFSKARPKQVGATTLNGPMLAALAQSFIAAINSGAVPTIATSWQSVEESECRRALEAAKLVYTKALNITGIVEESALVEGHSRAVKVAHEEFSREAMGELKARMFVESEKDCLQRLTVVEDRLGSLVNKPEATVDEVFKALESSVEDYCQNSSGPAKWKNLANFLRRSLTGILLSFILRSQEHLKASQTLSKAEVVSANDKLEASLREVAAVERNAEELKSMHARALRRIEELERNNRDLSDKLTTAESRSDKLKLGSKQTSQEVMELQSRLMASAQEVATWKRKFEVTAAEVQESAGKTEEVSSLSRQQEARLKAESASTIVRKDQELEDALQHVSRSRSEADVLRGRLREAEQRLQELQKEYALSQIQMKEKLAAESLAEQRAEEGMRQISQLREELMAMQEELLQAREAAAAALAAPAMQIEDNREIEMEEGGEEAPFEDAPNHSGSYAKDLKSMTVTEIKQELTSHGFGSEVIELYQDKKKRPLRKDFATLYERLVLKT